jgi:hypothetical protein
MVRQHAYRTGAFTVYLHAVLEEWARESRTDKAELWRRVLARIDSTF